MPVAGPSEYLLVGRGGRLENRGSAVRARLLPGAIWLLVPASKQEASFEFTQETRDGIPLRFKGVIVFRITDPVAAAALFDFSGGTGLERIRMLLTAICLGELRDAVSHMTMAECIEGRKTTLSEVARNALDPVVRGRDGGSDGWGVGIDVAQLAQVFIVDPQLRGQLEAEVRNEIKLRSDRSDIRTREEARLSEMASDGRLEERRNADERERLRRDEELEQARMERDRRMAAEQLATDRQALALEQARLTAGMAAERHRLETETPVRLARVARESEVVREELAAHRARNELRALEVEHELMLRRAEQDLRREILPLEQSPRIVEAASQVLHGTNLSVYGADAAPLGQLAPLFDVLVRAVRGATAAPGETA